MLTVISDTGHVCSAQVLQGVDIKTDADVVKTVRSWNFEPARRDGRAVPTVVTLEVKYLRDKAGHLVYEPTDGPKPVKESPQ